MLSAFDNKYGCSATDALTYIYLPYAYQYALFHSAEHRFSCENLGELISFAGLITATVIDSVLKADDVDQSIKANYFSIKNIAEEITAEANKLSIMPRLRALGMDNVCDSAASTILSILHFLNRTQESQRTYSELIADTELRTKIKEKVEARNKSLTKTDKTFAILYKIAVSLITEQKHVVGGACLEGKFLEKCVANQNKEAYYNSPFVHTYSPEIEKLLTELKGKTTSPDETHVIIYIMQSPAHISVLEPHSTAAIQNMRIIDANGNELNTEAKRKIIWKLKRKLQVLVTEADYI